MHLLQVIQLIVNDDVVDVLFGDSAIAMLNLQLRKENTNNANWLVRVKLLLSFCKIS